MIAVISTAALAQHMPGSWRLVQRLGVLFSNVVDTKDKVYYTTGGVMYSFDKKNKETKYYTPGTELSSTGISKIYYNYDNDYMLVTYADGNIDMLRDNGELINIPDIRDANITYDKGINDVVFDGNRFYVATNFGIVVFNDTNYQVVESGIYGKPINNIMVLEDQLVLYTASPKSLLMAPLSVRHKDISVFTTVSTTFTLSGGWFRLSKNNALYNEGSVLRRLYYDAAANTLKNIWVYISSSEKQPGMRDFTRYKNGVYYICEKGIAEVSESLEIKFTPLPDAILKDHIIAMYESPASIWVAESESRGENISQSYAVDPLNRSVPFSGEWAGLANYDITGGNLTVLSDKYRPQGSGSFESAFITPDYDNTGVIINNIGLTWVHPSGDYGWGKHHGLVMERYDWEKGTFESLHPYGNSGLNSMTQAEYNKFRTGQYFGGPQKTVADIENTGLIFHANYTEGLVILKDRQVLHAFNHLNSPFVSASDSRVFDVAFDNFGNLWVGYWATGNKTGHPYYVLAADKVAKLRLDPTSIVTSDWEAAKWPSEMDGEYNPLILFSNHPGSTNKYLWMNGSYQRVMIGFDNRGTSALSDDNYVIYNGFYDQDGSFVDPIYRTGFVQDKNGHIWISTTEGVYVIKDLDQIAVSDRLNVVRPKVARNDGTNYADYLLSTDCIYMIAVDSNNHKWIATEKSGLYHVNADGTEIIESFTKDNSPLLSNCVLTVACDPNSNDVLIGTPDGMYVYSSTSSPAADDYSSVIVYPNPVRPDYTGWITISGLMDNSLVKIADSQGHVIAQGRSEGGMYIWDGCNAAGQRVRSGVYMVFASQSDGAETNGAVSKIVVIN